MGGSELLSGSPGHSDVGGKNIGKVALGDALLDVAVDGTAVDAMGGARAGALALVCFGGGRACCGERISSLSERGAIVRSLTLLQL